MAQINIIDPKLEKLQKKSPTPPAAGPGQQGIGPNLMEVIFALLVEEANITAANSEIRAKGLQKNALSQQRLEKEAEELQWNYIPKEQVRHRTVVYHTKKWRWTWWGKFHRPCWYRRTKVVKQTYVANQGAIDAAQSKNQKVAALRQEISEQLSVDQQEAQVKETNLNSQLDIVTQILQESSQLMDILKSLTFKALLRKPT